MKKLLILFVFAITSSFSQGQVFDFWSNKAYKIAMKGASSFINAENISRQSEEMQIVVFSYVDPSTSTGYFIVSNFSKVQEIEKMINSDNGFSFIGYEEVTFNKDLFLEMYMKRGGYQKIQFSTNKPKEITMGLHKDLTTNLYTKALDVWEDFYGKGDGGKLNGVPQHYPVFVNTGNPENDNLKFEQAKQEWIKNYPEETEYSTGRPYEGVKNKESKNSEKK